MKAWRTFDGRYLYNFIIAVKVQLVGAMSRLQVYAQTKASGPDLKVYGTSGYYMIS